MTKPVCIVVGIGPGNGAAFAKRFARDYRVAMLSRRTDYAGELAKQLPGAQAFACDVADPDAVTRAFGEVSAKMGAAQVLLYNAGSGVWGNVEDVSVDDFELAWKINCRGALLASRQVIPGMLEAGKGAIVFTGATASLRGGANFAAFASAKAAQRNLAQSMARHLWPKGIHVGLLILDGMVDLPRTRERMPDAPDDKFLKPAAIADTVCNLVHQDRSAWSFEVEAHPFAETW